MSEHALAQQQMTDTTQEAGKDALSLRHRHTNQAEPTTLPRLLFDVAPGSFAEPRFGYDFSLVPAHTDMVQRAQPLLRTGTMVQRYPVNGDADSAPCATCSEESTPVSVATESTREETAPAPEAAPTSATTEPEEESAAPEETTAPALLVEDSAAELAPGQMRKSEFLAQLRAEVTSAAESAMAGTGRTTADCPYLGYWFDYYSAQDVQHGERALRRYAPEASSATTAGEYISIVTGRVRRSVQIWARTGEVTGVPEGVPTTVPGAGGGGEGAVASTAPVMAKARDGGVRSADNPQAIQAELGHGRPLDGGVRSRMEFAFGRDFSHVRTHTDTTAGGLSSRLNARAFTVGEHVAFGAGEYRPETMIGDALIAHELAHVVQQDGASTSLAPMERGDSEISSFEADADQSAVGAVMSLWGGAKDKLKDIARNARPRLSSGLHLFRCSSNCPTQTVTMSGAACGTIYGAIGTYCYSGAENWWFKETVVQGSPDTCVPGATISQTTNPGQSPKTPSNCVDDRIFNRNGPPASIAPCKDVTNQTMFTGPTKATVEKCKYDNEQVIEVTVTPGSTPPSGKVITSSAGESTECNWP